MAGYRQTYGGYGPQQPYHGTYQPESHQNSFLPYPTPGGYRDREAPYILDRPYESPPLLDVSELLARDPPPLIVPRPLFDDREGVRDGRGFGSGDRFYPEPDTHTHGAHHFHRERYENPHQSLYYPSREDQLDSHTQFGDPHRQMGGPFHDDVEWEESGFSMGATHPQSTHLMQGAGTSRVDGVHQSGYTGFENRFATGETGFEDRFPGGAHDLHTSWPGDGFTGRESDNLGMSVSSDWERRRTMQDSHHYSSHRHGFDGERTNFDVSSVGPPHLAALPMSGRSRHLSSRYPKGPSDPRDPHFKLRSSPKRGRPKDPRHRRQPPPSSREEGRRRDGRGDGGRHTQGDMPSRSTRRPSSGEARRDVRSSESVRESVRAEKKVTSVKKSPEVFQTRNTKEMFADDAKGTACNRGREVFVDENKSLSPVTIQERLGPHIPGRGSVQNRLGPPKKGASGVHSRLGPEENSSVSLDDIRSSTLKSEENMSTSESFQFRLGPEENLGSSSTSVHSRLGPEEVSIGSITSHALLEETGTVVTEARPPSRDVHSRLGPVEVDSITPSSRSMSGTLDTPDHFSSDHNRSRLGADQGGTTTFSSHSVETNTNFLRSRDPAMTVHSSLGSEETYAAQAYSGSIRSEFESRESIGDPLGDQSVYSRLGPGQDCGTDDVLSRLGPEVSSVQRHPKMGLDYRDMRPETEQDLEPLVDYHSMCPETEPNFETRVNYQHMYSQAEPNLEPQVNYEDMCPQTEPNLEPQVGYQGMRRDTEPNLVRYQDMQPEMELNLDPCVEFPKIRSPVPGEVSLLESLDLCRRRRSSNFDDAISSEHPQHDHLQFGFQSYQSVTDSRTTAPTSCYVVMDDKTTLPAPQFSEIGGGRTPGNGPSIHFPVPCSDVDTRFVNRATIAPTVSTTIAATTRGSDLVAESTTGTTPDFSSQHQSPLENRAVDTYDSVNCESRTSDLDVVTVTSGKSVPGKYAARKARKRARQKALKVQRFLSNQQTPEVGQSIPTLLKKQIVPPPAKKEVPSPARKEETERAGLRNLSRSVRSPYGSHMPAIGYKDNSTRSDVRRSGRLEKVSFTIAKRRELESVNPMATKKQQHRTTRKDNVGSRKDNVGSRKSKVGSAAHSGMEPRQSQVGSGTHTGMELRQSQVKVGVAKVVRAEREIEEGELTDSDCECLVIDLDTSSSSLPPPPAAVPPLLPPPPSLPPSLPPPPAPAAIPPLFPPPASLPPSLPPAAALPLSSSASLVTPSLPLPPSEERSDNLVSCDAAKSKEAEVVESISKSIPATEDVKGQSKSDGVCEETRYSTDKPDTVACRNELESAEVGELAGTGDVCEAPQTTKCITVEVESMESDQPLNETVNASGERRTVEADNVESGDANKCCIVGAKDVKSEDTASCSSNTTPPISTSSHDLPTSQAQASTTQPCLLPAITPVLIRPTPTTCTSATTTTSSTFAVSTTSISDQPFQSLSREDDSDSSTQPTALVAESEQVEVQKKEEKVKETTNEEQETEPSSHDEEVATSKPESDKTASQVVVVHDDIEIENEQKEVEVPTESTVRSPSKTTADAELTGELKAKENKDCERNTELEPKVGEDDIETISISSGEIVSSNPPSPCPAKEDTFSKNSEKSISASDDHHKSFRGSFEGSNWRGRGYFAPEPPSQRRDFTRDQWRPRSPIRRHRWSLSVREFSRFVKRRFSRSRSRSPSPVRSWRRDELSRRGPWKRCSSPEEVARRRRWRQSRSSLSPDGRFGRAEVGQKRRKTTDGGERYGRGRRTRSSQSCDRASNRDSCESSDEDLEVLELRKEAILSMLTDAPLKRSHEARVDSACATEGSTVGDAGYEKKTGEGSIECEQVYGEAEVKRSGKERHKPAKSDTQEVSGKAKTKQEEEAKLDEVLKSPWRGEKTRGEMCVKTSANKKTSVTHTTSAATGSMEADALSKKPGNIDESQNLKSSTSQFDHTSQLSISSRLSARLSPPPVSSVVERDTKARLGVPSGKRVQGVSLGRSVSLGKVVAVAGSSRSGSRSRNGSPASSLGSPAKSSSVKIIPGSKGTWEVPEFNIQLAESEEELSETETETSREGIWSGYRPPTVEEIDSVLGVFRREAEVKAKNKEKMSRSPDRSLHPPLPTARERQKSPEVVVTSIDLTKSDAVGMLPLQLQREYLELKTKLALHAKKQKEVEIAVKAKDKGKRPLNATLSKKAKLIKSISSPKSSTEDVGVTKQTVERNSKDRERQKLEEQRRKEADEQRRRREEQQKAKERERVKFERRKKKREMKISELEGKIRSCRSQSEQWAKTLTAQTHSLTECESELEERELKIELLSKQLSLAKSSQDKCKRQISELQSQIQEAKENIGRHTSIIQSTQQLLIRERQSLIAMESGNHSDSTDMDTVSMEMDSDGTKGEEAMDIVTTSSEEEEESNNSTSEGRKITLAPLSFEAVSDSEESLTGSQSTSSQQGVSVPPVSVVSGLRGVSRARGKRRRMSRSQRSRKSSLSVTHTATELASDSDTEGSEAKKPLKTRKTGFSGKAQVPPVPSYPPPLTPPPPPHAPVTKSPNSLLSLAAHTLPNVTPAPAHSPTLASTSSSTGDTKTSQTSEVSVADFEKSEAVLSATLPIAPIDVEFITDTDTASESGLPGSIPLVSFRDPMLSGIRSDDAPTPERMEVPLAESDIPHSVPTNVGQRVLDAEAFSVSSSGCVPVEVDSSPLSVPLSMAGNVASDCCELVDQHPLVFLDSLPLDRATSDSDSTTVRGSSEVDHSNKHELPSVKGVHESESNDQSKSDLVSGSVQLLTDSEPCGDHDNATMSLNPMESNPFVSMLKIAKVESLSESSETFSPVTTTINPSVFHTIMSRELGQASNVSVASYVGTSSRVVPNTATATSQSTAEHSNQAVTEGGTPDGTTSVPKANDVLRPETQHAIGSDLEETAIAAMDCVSQLNVDTDCSTDTHREERDGSKTDTVERGKSDTVIMAESGATGRVTQRGVRKLPLFRSGSDSVVVVGNKRESTQNRSVAKTTDSSPSSTSKSLTLSPVIEASPTLNRALQSTLTSALAPALQSALGHSQSSQVLSDPTATSAPLSPMLCSTLQRTLDKALSPVLESMLAISPSHNQAGDLRVPKASAMSCGEMNIEILPQSRESEVSHEPTCAAQQLVSAESQTTQKQTPSVLRTAKSTTSSTGPTLTTTSAFVPVSVAAQTIGFKGGSTSAFVPVSETAQTSIGFKGGSTSAFVPVSVAAQTSIGFKGGSTTLSSGLTVTATSMFVPVSETAQTSIGFKSGSSTNTTLSSGTPVSVFIPVSKAVETSISSKNTIIASSAPTQSVASKSRQTLSRSIPVKSSGVNRSVTVTYVSQEKLKSVSSKGQPGTVPVAVQSRDLPDVPHVAVQIPVSKAQPPVALTIPVSKAQPPVALTIPVPKAQSGTPVAMQIPVPKAKPGTHTVAVQILVPKAQQGTAPVAVTTIPVSKPQAGVAAVTTEKLGEKGRGVRAHVVKSQVNVKPTSLSVEGFLGKIKQVKSNLEKQVQSGPAGRSKPSVEPAKPVQLVLLVHQGPHTGQTEPVQQAPHTEQTKLVTQQASTASQVRNTQVSTKKRSVLAKQVEREKPVISEVTFPTSHKLAKEGKAVVTGKERPQKPVKLAGKAVIPVRKEVNPTWKKERRESELLQLRDMKEPAVVEKKKRGEEEPAGDACGVGIVSEEQVQGSGEGLLGMDDIVMKLGFEMTWAELQVCLETSDDALSPIATDHHGNDVPFGLFDETLLETGATVSESVLESVLSENHPSSSADEVGRSARQLRRYRPYTSPLLSLSSYRLNPNYRTHGKLSLSSLSHSNKVDPMKIWCKYEVFGKCSDPQCTGQHLRDITLSKSELIDDIIAYAPGLSSDGTEIRKSDQTKPQVAGDGTLCAKMQSFGASLWERFSGKMSEYEMLVLASHQVSEAQRERERGGVFDMEEIRARESLARVKEDTKKTRQPPLCWDAQVTAAFSVAPATTSADSCSTTERYFSVRTSPDATPTNPTSPAHFLSEAEETNDPLGTSDHLESSFSQELWVEYLENKRTQLSDPSCHGKRTELLTKALDSCPTYAVVAKCIQVAVTVTEKSSWIMKGYHAITTTRSEEVPFLSLCCLELLLSHAYLHCISGHHDDALSTLELSLGSKKNDGSQFSGITAHLSRAHLQLVHLSLIHITYTSSFPHLITLTHHTSPTLPLRIKQDMNFTFLIPWSNSRKLTAEKQRKIERSFSVAMEHCQCQPNPGEAMETTFALYHNLVLFLLTHVSQDAAWQVLRRLVFSPHSSEANRTPGAAAPFGDGMPSSAAQFVDVTLGSAAQFGDVTPSSAMVVQILEMAKCLPAEFYCCTVKLVTKQKADCCHDDMLNAALPWLRSCLCKFYDISDKDQLSLTDTALLFRKLLGQMMPYDYETPERVGRERERESLPYLWVAYCLLVRLSHHTLRGSCHPSTPEEAFESAVHSVDGASNLRIVWLEYLTYLRDVAVKNRSSQSAFKALSDCVYRCLVVMDTKQAPPNSLPGQPTHYHNYSFQEQVCDLFFTVLPQSSRHVVSLFQKLLVKIPDSACLVARYTHHCLHHSPSSLGKAQSVLASFLAHNPNSHTLWRLAIQVELAMKNKREARWLFREAVKNVPLSADLWKEFLLFELRSLSPSPSISLAQDVVTSASSLGVKLTHTHTSHPHTSHPHTPPPAQP